MFKEFPDYINYFWFFNFYYKVNYSECSLLWIAINKYYVWKQLFSIKFSYDLTDYKIFGKVGNLKSNLLHLSSSYFTFDSENVNNIL